jgi:hypothetical protein
MAELIKSDLEFILQHILIAEAHTAGTGPTSSRPRLEQRTVGLADDLGRYADRGPAVTGVDRGGDRCGQRESVQSDRRNHRTCGVFLAG